MPSLSDAPLDRRIRVLASSRADALGASRVSELHSWPYIVLLGEPGMGKTTALTRAAEERQSSTQSVRKFIMGDSRLGGVPLFLDGLDEYRPDREQRTDKVERLVSRLREAAPPDWWISCRVEDWSDDYRDMLESVTGPNEIVVARLEALDKAEALALLRALGEENPEPVWARAQAFGALAFLENPLSVTLMVQTAGATGKWPKTRFDLFHAATLRLAQEQNPRRGLSRPRDAPEATREAASRMCALLLLSNQWEIWRSNIPYASSVDSGNIVSWFEFDIAPSLLLNTLDTALFRQAETDVFVPMHRAVAEFLAGHALAVAVAGGTDKSRYPLSRVLAFIAGSDGRALSELRGVYAWTAVHLSRMHLDAEAQRLIRQDAATIVVYGDAAVLTEPQRRLLLQSLTKDDPWFRAADEGEGDTAVGALAGDDLENDFAAILRNRTDQSHLFLTVTEALTYGAPVPSLRVLLREIALDDTREVWQRGRAAEAWAAGASDRGAARHELYLAASQPPCSDKTVALRLELIERLPADLPVDDDVRKLLQDFATARDEKTVGHLFPLQLRLQRNPRPGVLEFEWGPWLDEFSTPLLSSTVRQALWGMLAAIIKAAPATSGSEFWRWMTNIHRHAYIEASVGQQYAMKGWLASRPGVERELYAAIAASAGNERGPRLPMNEFIRLTGAIPSAEVVAALLADESALFGQFGAGERIDMATEIAVQAGEESKQAALVVAYLRGLDCTPETRAKTDALLHPAIPEWKRKAEQYRMAQQAEVERQREALRLEYATAAPNLAAGTDLTRLANAAWWRFGSGPFGAQIGPGVERVVEFVGEEVAAAIALGWRHVAMTGIGIEPDEIGRAMVNGLGWYAEAAILAGLDEQIVATGNEAAFWPLQTALHVLNAAGSLPLNARMAFVTWAIERLEASSGESTSWLVTLWKTAIEMRPEGDLPVLSLLNDYAPGGGVCARALQGLLRDHPMMPERALVSALVVAIRLTGRADLSETATTALAVDSVCGEPRAIWQYLAFCLDPQGASAPFSVLFADPSMVGAAFPWNRLSVMLIEDMTTATRARFAASVISLLAPRQAPAMRMTNSSEAEDLVWRELAWLERCEEESATDVLRDLADAPAMANWRDQICHRMAKQLRLRRQATHVPATVRQIREALAGGSPVNSSDLQAVVVDELRKIQAAMQVDPLLPWQLFWNEDSKRSAPEQTPKVENSCRNVVGLLLQAKLGAFGITVPPLPEASRAAETRTDILILSGAGRNLPIEAKRHFHPQVWAAVDGQLKGYTADLGADGLGIYLVFWFGSVPGVSMPRREGEDYKEPGTAAEMESMLREDLSDELRARIEIVVLDVSNPKGRRGSARRRASSTRHARNGTAGG